jgi:hypothetical protein
VNITLSIDDATVDAARRVAREQGTSLNDLVRRFVANLAGQRPPEERARHLLALFENQPGDSGGRKFTRDDAYEGRL